MMNGTLDIGTVDGIAETPQTFGYRIMEAVEILQAPFNEAA